MRQTFIPAWSATAAATAVAMAAFVASPPTQAEPIVGLLAPGSSVGNSLITFDSATPGIAATFVAVAGLVADNVLVGLDLRPSTGVLYGLGNFGGLYTLNSTTGAATPIGQVSVALSGIAFGIDFNPVADLEGAASLRITSNLGQNLRVNVNVGLIGTATVDGALNCDNCNGGLFASAYANNDRNPATGTALFGIASTGFDQSLYQQANPNAGTLVLIGDLGVGTVGGFVGFDVSGLSGTSFVSVRNATGPADVHSFFSINFTTGVASLIGAIDSSTPIGNLDVIGITAATIGPVPEPEAYAMMLMGLTAVGWLTRRRPLEA